MGKLEELRELRRIHEGDMRSLAESATVSPTLDEFVGRDRFADGSQRVPSDYKVEKGLGCLQVTLYEHMEGWKLVVDVQTHQEVAGALEKALNDLDHPRFPYKTYKPLPKWWLELQKKNGHSP